MGFTKGGAGPPGALFHWATKTDDGFRVVDVWESREPFDSFAQEKIGPLTQQAGPHRGAPDEVLRGLQLTSPRG